MCAQLPERLERCLPYPSLAQEISAMSERTDPSQEPSPKTKRTIISVKFGPETQLPQSLRTQIVRSIRHEQFYYDSESDWLEELQEVGIKGLLQDSGYFRPKVNADAHVIGGTHRNKRYALTLHIDEGRQYRLGDISFVSVNDDAALAFPASELQEHIRLTRGELFNASKIRNGVEELTRLYGTKGYIDMVPIPEIQNEEDDGPINLVMRLDQGKPYRVGKVEFLGLNEKMQNELTPKLKPGDVFNKNLVDQIIKRNKPLLPPDASWDDVSVQRNTKDGTVDILFDFRVRFDFRTCSMPEH
jgi:outer membrane translocation and assembly module TamA